MKTIGLDIGGANLKVSDGQQTLSVPFPMWQTPDQLSHRLAEILKNFPAHSPLAVTMTGELADCFTTRSEGVRFILAAVEAAAPQSLIRVWQTGGEFFSVSDAVEFPELVAAANWHALATWAGRMCPDSQGWLIDMGSTTTDIIPISEGLPIPEGLSDKGRLTSGELLYWGVRRTPVCTVVENVTDGASQIGVARDLFATLHDVMLLLGKISENPDCFETANGKPATIEAARDRMARVVCSDREELTEQQIRTMANDIYQQILNRTSAGIARLLEPEKKQPAPMTILISGEGEFLVQEAIQNLKFETSPAVLSLSQLLGPVHSSGACAYALSQLGNER